MKTLILSRTSEVDVEKCVRVMGGNRFDAILMAANHARQLAKDDANTLPSTITALLDIQKNGIDALKNRSAK